MNDPLERWQPTATDPFDLPRVGHLLRRAGYAASLQVRLRLVDDGLDAALQWICKPPPADAVDFDAIVQDAIAFDDIERVRAWRVLRALDGEAPLHERLSAFWHGHFATSNQKLHDPRAMALQFATFDRLGAGRFDDLLRAMARDPALLRWLDNDTNGRDSPNENFARELFELFTLGRGHYTEADVREAARAFTGHEVHGGHFKVVTARHDGGDKTVLGRRGALVGDDVAALLAAEPASARWLAQKWLQHFVHPEPAIAHVEALARCYEQHDRDVGKTLAVLLASQLFFAAENHRCRIKSPAEFAIGLVRGLGAHAAARDVARAMARMGEAWCEPPSVEGWHGDRDWLSPAAFLLRSNFAAGLLGGQSGKLQPDMHDLLRSARTDEQRCRLAVLHLLDGECSHDSKERLLAFVRSAAGMQAKDSAVLHAVTLLPEYHLL